MNDSIMAIIVLNNVSIEELDQLTNLFAEEISSIEFQQLIFCTDRQLQLPKKKE